MAALVDAGEHNAHDASVSTERRSDANCKGPKVVRNVVDSGFFRQPVVRSGGAVRRPAAPSRRTPFREVESLVARASPSPTRDAFSIGDSNRNTN